MVHGMIYQYKPSKREWKEEGRGLKRVYNQMGEARHLKLLNIAAWLISAFIYLYIYIYIFVVFGKAFPLH